MMDFLHVLQNTHGIQMPVLIVLVDISDVVTYEIDLSVRYYVNCIAGLKY